MASFRDSTFRGCALILSGLASSVACGQSTPSYDVVVYGGTSSGVAAAVQAARMGLKVAIVEQTNHLGGMSSNGLSHTDTGDTSVIGGFAGDLYRRIGRAYGETGAEYNFEPHVAENTFDSLVSESGVDVYYGNSLPDSGGVTKSGTIVTSIQVADTANHTLNLSGKTFIDASYTGDLMAASGIASTVGREANSQYGETYNGVQTARAVKNQLTVNVDPYNVPGDPWSGLIKGISSAVPGPDGSADSLVQAYTYRLTLTNVASNRRSWTQPAGYDPSQYVLASRYINALTAAKGSAPDITTLLKLDSLKNGKFDLNNNGGVSTDLIGGSLGYPAGSKADRASIEQSVKTYELGLLYFLATDPSVPQALRNQMNSYGLTKDEFTDNGGVSDQIYVREARRMLGNYVMTDNNVLGKTSVSDAIALGSYTMDSHNVQRYVDANGKVVNEGDVQVKTTSVGVTPYGISYQSLVPLTSQATNVIVPVAMSASHIAYGSIRVEPALMELGQAAGAAAYDAVVNGTTVQGVNTAQLQAQLQSYGAILSTSAGSAARFTGTVTEDFNYGPSDNRIDIVSYANRGWASAYSYGRDTSNSDATNLSGAAPYSASANLTYTANGYRNAPTVGTLVSGGLRGGNGSNGAGIVASRGITGGMTGVIWISALAELDSNSVSSEDSLLWLDRTSSGNSDNAGNAFIGLRGGGKIALRYGGTNNLFESDGAIYAANSVHLLLARIDIDANGTTADTLQFWIDPNLSAGGADLGAANLSIAGINLFGSSFDGIGVSVGSGGGMMDAIRISNAADGFGQVTALPEPACAATLIFSLPLMVRNRKKKRSE